MATLKQSKQRDFIKQVLVIIGDNQHLMKEKGLDPTAKLALLHEKWEKMETVEGEKLQAKAELKDATRRSGECLKDTYTDASGLVDVFTGLLGKNNELVAELKKLRK